MSERDPGVPHPARELKDESNRCLEPSSRRKAYRLIAAQTSDTHMSRKTRMLSLRSVSVRIRPLLGWAFLGMLFALPTDAFGQQRVTHRLLRADLPPGVVGRIQAQSVPSRFGYFQPTEVRVPEGAFISIASDGNFATLGPSVRASLQLGEVYRLKITNIPQHENAELFPSIEVIDRLHPPEGEADRFPIPIEITQDDLELALRGAMVVRVIYLENPAEALPVAEDKEQFSIDVGPGEDPLQVADEQGRPMAILRIGSKGMPTDGGDDEFFFGSPPLHWLSDPVESGTPVLGEPIFDSGQAAPMTEPTPAPSLPATPRLEQPAPAPIENQPMLGNSI